MAREIAPGVVQLDDADLSDDERALVAWAEGDIHPSPDHPDTLTGEAAAGHSTTTVATALGGHDNLTKLLRGRPSLDPTAPTGEKSPVRQFRMPASMSAWLDEVARAQGRKPSEIIREALGLYLAETDPDHQPVIPAPQHPAARHPTGQTPESE
jgi:hypothetical protein